MSAASAVAIEPERSAVMRLEFRLLEALVIGRMIGALGAQHLFVEIERAACGTDRNRCGLSDQERGGAAEIERVWVQAGAFRRLVAASDTDRRDRAPRRDESVLRNDALRSGALHAHDVPVVDDAILVAGEQHLDYVRGRLAVGAGDRRAAEVMRADIAAGRGGP